MKLFQKFALCLALFAVLLGGCSSKNPQNQANTNVQNVSDRILDEMEGPPKNGHTLERHVGKTEDQLKARINKENVTAASTYYDKATATKAVQDALRTHEKEIDDWLHKSKRDRLVLNTHHSFDIGKTVLQSDMKLHDHLRDSVTVLARDNTGKLGFKIITSYPSDSMTHD
ncbi:RNase A-like domain-containing lipoprotein [Microbacteriaceae bacterium 4G12]